MLVQEGLDEGDEILRLLGVGPMTGTVEDGDLGAREVPVECSMVFWGDVARPPARDEQGGPGERGRGIGQGKS